MQKRLVKNDIRDLYLKVLDCTGINPENLWVSSGAAMVMHGLRYDTADIDSGCHQEAFDIARSMLHCEYVPFRKDHAYIPEGTPNLILNSEPMDILLEPNIVPDNLIMVDGVNCYNVYALLVQKTKLNRLKDQQDIEVLNHHIHQLKLIEEYSNGIIRNH